MASAADVHQMQKSIQSTILQRMTDFECQLKLSKSEPATLEKLNRDYDRFKEDVLVMMQLLQQQIRELTLSTDSLEMRHRRKCLLFGGVPEVEDSGNEDVAGVDAAILLEKFHIEEISASTFKACHRMGSKNIDRPRPILVHFVSHTVKSTVWRKKTSLKGSSMVVSEFLTRRRYDLFVEARRRFGMTKCWTLDGSIYVKPPSGKPINIIVEEDLERVAKAFETAASSSAAVAGPSAPPAPLKECSGAVAAAGEKQQRPKRAAAAAAKAK